MPKIHYLSDSLNLDHRATKQFHLNPNGRRTINFIAKNVQLDK